MRGMRLFLVLCGTAWGVAPAWAQTFPAEMTIIVPEVEVRSGPTKEYFSTSKLRQGERVLVLRESKDQAGWLAIRPPAGSFSWINAKYVKQVDARTAYVEGEGGQAIDVLPGSSVHNKAPNVVSAKVTPGFLATIVDRPMTAEGNTWLPILPPNSEVRFIPIEAVRAGAASNTNAPPGPGTTVNQSNPLITQADQALAAGQIDRAQQLYKEAAEKTQDYNQKIYCYNRLESLRKGSGAWTQPGQMQPAVATNQGKSLGQPTSFGGQGQSLSYPAQWSTWGVLRRVALEKEGQPVFVLESRQGQPLLYVVAAQGTSLRDYVGRMVSLYGPITYRSDDALRTNFMVASHVALP